MEQVYLHQEFNNNMIKLSYKGEEIASFKVSTLNFYDIFSSISRNVNDGSIRIIFEGEKVLFIELEEKCREFNEEYLKNFICDYRTPPKKSNNCLAISTAFGCLAVVAIAIPILSVLLFACSIIGNILGSGHSHTPVHTSPDIPFDLNGVIAVLIIIILIIGVPVILFLSYKPRKEVSFSPKENKLRSDDKKRYNMALLLHRGLDNLEKNPGRLCNENEIRRILDLIEKNDSRSRKKKLLNFLCLFKKGF